MFKMARCITCFFQKEKDWLGDSSLIELLFSEGLGLVQQKLSFFNKVLLKSSIWCIRFSNGAQTLQK